MYGGPRRDSMPDRGTNPDFGAVIYYHLRADSGKTGPVSLEILNSEGEVLRSFSSQEKSPAKKLMVKGGLNKFVWNLQTAPIESIPGLMTLGGNAGYMVNPGTYRIRLIQQGDSLESELNVLADPRLEIPEGAIAERGAVLSSLYQAKADLYAAVKDLRQVQAQLQSLIQRLDPEDEKQEQLKQAADSLLQSIEAIEGQLIQTQQQTFQDVINFPNQLDAKLGHIMGMISGSPPPLTSGQKERAEDMLAEWKRLEAEVASLLGDQLTAFNQMVREAQIPFIGL